MPLLPDLDPDQRPTTVENRRIDKGVEDLACLIGEDAAQEQRFNLAGARVGAVGARVDADLAVTLSML